MRRTYDVFNADRRFPDYRGELISEAGGMPDGCECGGGARPQTAGLPLFLVRAAAATSTAYGIGWRRLLPAKKGRAEGPTSQHLSGDHSCQKVFAASVCAALRLIPMSSRLSPVGQLRQLPALSRPLQPQALELRSRAPGPPAAAAGGRIVPSVIVVMSFSCITRFPLGKLLLLQVQQIWATVTPTVTEKQKCNRGTVWERHDSFGAGVGARSFSTIRSSGTFGAWWRPGPSSRRPCAPRCGR